MDDLLNKTRELSSIVSSLKDKGEDNVELQGILAQLQAAVAKRTTAKPADEPVPTEIVAKTEPVEPEPVEPEHTDSLNATALASTSGELTATRLPDDLLPENIEKPLKTSKRPPRKRNPAAASRPKRKRTKQRIKSESSSEEYLDGDDGVDSKYFWYPQNSESSGTNQRKKKLNKNTLQGLQDEGGMTLDAYVNPVTGALEESPFHENRLEDGDNKPEKKKRFKAVCKLCEVQASITMKSVTESSMSFDPTSNNICVLKEYNSSMAFASHLRADHGMTGENLGAGNNSDNESEGSGYVLPTDLKSDDLGNTGANSLSRSNREPITAGTPSAGVNISTTPNESDILANRVESIAGVSATDVSSYATQATPSNVMTSGQYAAPMNAVNTIADGFGSNTMPGFSSAAPAANTLASGMPHTVTDTATGVITVFQTDMTYTDISGNQKQADATVIPSVAGALVTAVSEDGSGVVTVPAEIIKANLVSESAEKDVSPTQYTDLSNPNIAFKLHPVTKDEFLSSSDKQPITAAPQAGVTNTTSLNTEGGSMAISENVATRKSKAGEPSFQQYLSCPHCDKQYSLHGTAKSCYDQLVFHMHRRHGEALPDHTTLYTCDTCPFQTLRHRDLVRHQYVVHTEHEPRGVQCEICGKKVLPTSMQFHMAAVHGSEDVPEQVKVRTQKMPCEYCGKEFKGEINLQRHIKCVHSKIRDQLCHLCSQTFFAKRELQLHMFATHKINMSNMKVFTCPTEGCDYQTLAKRHLYIHSAVHAETKDFICPDCAKAFKSKPALAQHVRIMHVQDVQYNCPKCSFTSHAKQYVQRHMVVHSDNKRHKCDFEGCIYATHFIENLTKHKKKHRKDMAMVPAMKTV